MIPEIIRTLYEMGEPKTCGFHRTGIEAFVMPSSGPHVHFLPVRCGACGQQMDVEVEKDTRYYASVWRTVRKPMCPRCGNTGGLE